VPWPELIPALTVTSGGARTVALPAAAWVASFDVRGRRLVVRAGSVRVLTLARASRWRHVEITNRWVSVDGRSFRWRSEGALPLSFTGSAAVRALIVSAASDRGALLLHRLAELHARVPVRRFPEGAGVDDRLHYGDRYWTSGFWPGALWQAAALAPAGGLFARWALQATVAHFGQERADTHDVGFMYGQSSLAAFAALCQREGPHPRVCARLRRSTLSAADELVALAAANSRAGAIPTRSTSGDTIVDSMMNIAILPWATRVTGDPVYARVASRHAHAVASLLVRSDGSTAQSVNFDPATGRVLLVSTHQGLSAASTWSRGQGWAVYGFAVAASELHDAELLHVALRTAAYVARHLPAVGVPPWDYDAPPGSPVDVSAGVITAAGLFHLAQACGSFPGVCPNPGQWRLLGRRMLAAALSHASSVPPLGFLGGQVLNERGRGCWCDGGELIFGLTYGLEALRLSENG
jgi:unsaturated chondroitin disaccharide hydrolase